MYRGRSMSMVIGNLLSLSLASSLFAQEDVTRKRKTFMRETYDAMKAIKRGVEEKDYTTIELKAKDIMGDMDKLVDYFPKGSISEKSNAKAEIWDKWDEFKKLPVKVKDVANGLAKAAAAKDEAGVQTQFQALGAAGSPFRPGVCYDCHKSFVTPPPQVKKTGG